MPMLEPVTQFERWCGFVGVCADRFHLLTVIGKKELSEMEFSRMLSWKVEYIMSDML